MSNDTVIGHVDGFEGWYVTGWAHHKGGGPCEIAVQAPSGQILGKGLASLPRPDLTGLRLGTTSVAFKILIQPHQGLDAIHVKADNQELPNSPLRFGTGNFDGHIALEGATLSGWILERSLNEKAPVLEIVDADGILITRVETSPSDGADPAFKPFVFSVRVPSQCFGASNNTLTVFVNSVRFKDISFSARLAGHLDKLTASGCSGWLLSTDIPVAPLILEAYRNNVKVGSAICNLPRDDLKSISPEGWRCGFEMQFIVEDDAVLELSTLSLRLKASSRDILGGPYVTGRQHAFIAAARRISQGLRRQIQPGDLRLSNATLAMQTFIAGVRTGGDYQYIPKEPDTLGSEGENPHRITIIIPIYRGLEVTRDCIQSVLRARNQETDRVLLINDKSPDADMMEMLAGFAGQKNVVLLHNTENLGFIRTVNMGLNLCTSGDVLLLNSDTLMFSGAIDELCRIASKSSEIGTVTALSNNATIFSYPSPDHPQSQLSDVSWADLARVALTANSGRDWDVPTGHGFCMLIRRALLKRVPLLDERFGKGYGEENAMCLQAEDLGFRHVAAGGVFVQHLESISFGDDVRHKQLAENLPILASMYPEYTGTIMEFQKSDGLREARWALDQARLVRLKEKGQKFVVILRHGLGGGTDKMLEDFQKNIGYFDYEPIYISADAFGASLQCAKPLIYGRYQPQEMSRLLALIDSLGSTPLIIHHLLGWSREMLKLLRDFLVDKIYFFYAHDFYSLCPRVTLLDALGTFCNVAPSSQCVRCLQLGGHHESSRLQELSPEEHRTIFGQILHGASSVIAPSTDTAQYLKRVFGSENIRAVPHFEPTKTSASVPNYDAESQSVLIVGAIGPHKGSKELLDLVRLAYLQEPSIEFHLLGYTDRDEEFALLPNISIYGKYAPESFHELVASTRAVVALFLHIWPETYSYTLSEVGKLGIMPIVPDIGAPAERVRTAKFGRVFDFPFDARAVLKCLTDALHSAGAITRGRSSAECEDPFRDQRTASDYLAAAGLNIFFGSEVNERPSAMRAEDISQSHLTDEQTEAKLGIA